MPYTLNILAEEVHRDLSGGDIPNDSPYDREHIKDHVRDGVNEDLEVRLLAKAGQASPAPQMVVPYLVDVLLDTVTYRVYAELPQYFLGLEYNRGIQYVQEPKNLVSMVKVNNPTVTAHLAHGTFEGKNFGYFIEGMRIIWMRDIKKENIHKVRVGLIIGAPSSIDENTTLPLLPESIGRIKQIVKERILNRVPQDRLADTNPNLRQPNQ